MTLIADGKRIGMIRNALDFSLDIERLECGRTKELESLTALGLIPSEIDLRVYFDSSEKLGKVISQLDALWVVGGNAFLLNYAFQRSGLDQILKSMLGDEKFVYAGYSAGACILAPTLDGIHLVDDPAVKAAGYPQDLPTRSLGLLAFSIAPHWRSNHSESEQIDIAIEYFMQQKMPFITLRDGETYITELQNWQGSKY